MLIDKMKLRRELKKSDIEAVREILKSTGFFYEFEIKVALELVQMNLEKGERESGYVFIIVERDEQPIAFACYGKNPCTIDSYDLYWIVVRQDQKGGGIGKILMKKVEEDVAKSGGKNLWIETSSRPIYESTRAFYIKTDFEIVAELPDYYGKNDSKLVYLKKLD